MQISVHRGATAISMILVIGCSHEVAQLQQGRADMDAGMDSSVDADVVDALIVDSAGIDASVRDGGDGSCNALSCTTTMLCTEAVCMGELCVIRPRCGLGEECCADSCVPAGCNDTVECTVDACGATGCEHTPTDSLCMAVSGGTCDAVTGTCQYPVCDMTTCVAGPCEMAHCEGTTCVREPACTAAQECCAGSCVARGCDDGNTCTNDSCGSSGCVHTNNTVGCDDGNMCNGTDTCSGGACRAHTGGLPEQSQCGLVPQRCCGGVCVDTRFDGNHCGFCGNICPTAGCALVGSAGACFCDSPTSCPSGFDCDATRALCSCRGGGSCSTGQSCSTIDSINVCVY